MHVLLVTLLRCKRSFVLALLCNFLYQDVDNFCFNNFIFQDLEIMYDENDTKKIEGFSPKLQRFMNTPGALFVQILWQFGVLLLCAISIWQIFRIPHLDPPPNQDFMKLSYPDTAAKFRNGALSAKLTAEAAKAGIGGISASSQRRDMRIFLIWIVAFSVPSSILNLAKLLRRYNGIAAKTIQQKDWLDNFGDFIWGIGNLGVFVTWIIGQVIYFHCIPTKYYSCLEYNFEIVTLTWIIVGYIWLFAPFGFVILHAVVYFSTR